MAVSNVHGLNRLHEYLHGFEDDYLVIGGAACDILMSDADLRFRATKDLDMILLADGRLPEVGRALWRMIKDGGYRCGWRGSQTAHFYRFTEPDDSSFPAMIELFSRAPWFLEEAAGLTIVPLPLGDEISSLSAILLDEDYYAFAKEGGAVVGGVSVLDAVHLVPFKAKASIDLAARKARGEHVNTKDLRKHKKDVFRLLALFGEERVRALPESLKDDLRLFCDQARTEGVPVEQLGLSLSLQEAIAFIEETYGLKKD